MREAYIAARVARAVAAGVPPDVARQAGARSGRRRPAGCGRRIPVRRRRLAVRLGRSWQTSRRSTARQAPIRWSRIMAAAATRRSGIGSAECRASSVYSHAHGKRTRVPAGLSAAVDWIALVTRETATGVTPRGTGAAPGRGAALSAGRCGRGSRVAAPRPACRRPWCWISSRRTSWRRLASRRGFGRETGRRWRGSRPSPVCSSTGRGRTRASRLNDEGAAGVALLGPASMAARSTGMRRRPALLLPPVPGSFPALPARLHRLGHRTTR